MKHAAVVPSSIALLSEYSSIDDPIAEMRAAAEMVVAWLVARHPEGVRIACAPLRPDDATRGVTEPAGLRIGRSLVEAAGGKVITNKPAPEGLLVVANGSATRTAKAPGSLDERAADFDRALVAALDEGDAAALTAFDAQLASELWCRDLPAFRQLADHMPAPHTAACAYVGDPYGVQYWVGTWTDLE